MVFLRMCAATAFLLVAADVHAQKIDVVVLQNGDRITCEVKELSRGQLRLSTDDAGTIYVEWDNVSAITTAGSYEVTLVSGAHFVGVLAPDSPTTLQVVAADGTATRLTFLEIVTMRSIRSRFFQRIDGSIDIGGSYTKSSGVGQFSVAFNATYRQPGYEIYTDFDANYTTQREAPPTSRFSSRSGYTRFLDNRWMINPFLFVERNPDLGLTLRGEAALAIGRYLHRSPRSVTILAGGAAGGVEQPIEGSAVANVDAVIGFTTSFYSYDFPRQNFDFAIILFPSLNDPGRVRANARAKFRHELFRDFLAMVTVYDTYDSRPPVPDVDVNDVGVTFSLGWTF